MSTFKQMTLVSTLSIALGGDVKYVPSEKYFQVCDPRFITEPGIYLYEHSGFTGRCQKFTSDRNDFRGTTVGNDKVSSIYIKGDYAATLYQNANYRGNSTTFVKSDPNIGSSSVGHDRASSLKIKRGYGADEPGVYLYEHSNYSGRCTRFKADARNFKIDYIQPNSASSIRIVGDYTATVYSGENFFGASTTFLTSDPDFNGHAIRHDRARSILVEPRQRVCSTAPGVYLYSETNFRGTCSRFTLNGRDSLNRHRIGDMNAASIRVSDGYTATLSRGDRTSTFTRNDTDLSDDRIGNNTASVIRVSAPNPESSNVYRLQIRIKTADKPDAETSDAVMVSLNQNNFTWLDYPREDFQRNDRFTFDLSTDGISTVADIKWISFYKPGDDGWCIESFELLINNQSRPAEEISPVVLYERRFPNGRWLDNNEGDRRYLTASFDELRQFSSWGTTRVPGVRTYIDSTEITSRIISAVGSAIHGTRAQWGKTHGPAVEISGRQNSKIKVDLDLSGAVTGPNVEVDIDFDIVISCSQRGDQSPVLTMKVENFRADVNWLADFLFNVEDRIEKQVPDIDRSIRLPQLRECPAITIESNGSVRII